MGRRNIQAQMGHTMQRRLRPQTHTQKYDQEKKGTGNFLFQFLLFISDKNSILVGE
jgi:hypothetical protein